MHEIALSNNLSQIELEINYHKNIAGQSIWAIGRRLNHVKENDLAHGEFRNWHERLGLDKDFVYKSMKIAKELPNVETLRHLGTTALHLIATLPADEQQAQIDRIEQGDNPTVRELQELRKQVKLKEQVNEILRDENSRLKEATVKEVVKEVEVIPDDYNEAISLSQELMESNKAHAERNAFLEQQLNQMSEQRDKANKYDDIERAIEQGRGQLNEQQKEIASTKEAIAFLKKGNQFLANFGGIAYLDIQSVLPKNAQLKVEVETFASQLKILLDDVNTILGQSQNEILEGEIL